MKPMSQKISPIFHKILAIFLIFSLVLPNIALAEDLVSETEVVDTTSQAEPLSDTLVEEVVIEALEEVPESSVEIETPEEEVVVEVVEEKPIEEIETPQIIEKEISNDEIIVKFKSDSVDVEDFALEKDLVVTDTFAEENISVVVSSDGESVKDTIENILENKEVEYAEPNYERTFESVESVNDPYFSYQWALQNTGQDVLGKVGTVNADINVPEAWEISEGEKQEIIVAVIDTGVDYTHPDLQNQMWDGSNCKDENGNLISSGCIHGYDFADNDTIPLPVEGTSFDFHGTHVAGIIAAQKNNEVGVSGVAPNVKIMALRFGGYVSSEIRAIDFARENGAKIINASYAGEAFSQAEYDAIKRFTDAGGIFITAAANFGRNNDDVSNTMHQFPSDHDLEGIVSVASTDQNDELSSWSNYGIESVDLGAPGSNILSTGLKGGYIYLSGTSMSTPNVVGISALLWGYNPELSPAQVKDILLTSGKELAALQGKTVTGKRADAFSAVSVFRPEVLDLNFSTTTEGLVTVNFNIRDGFAGLNSRLRGFEYSVDDGLTWTAPTSGDTSSSLDDNFKNVLVTTTSTSSVQSFVWNIQDEDVSNKEALLVPDVKSKFRFALFDGATTSPVVTSGVFSIVNATTTTPGPVPEPEPTPTPPSGGGGGGGGGSSGSSKDKQGDINGDDLVDILDFNALMIGWGKKGETEADLNDDGIVDILDFNILMINWK